MKWLGPYGDLDGILAHADEIKGVVGQNLRDQQENAIRNRRLNRLVSDVELDVELDELERQADRRRGACARSSSGSSSARCSSGVTKIAAGEATATAAAAPAAGDRAARTSRRRAPTAPESRARCSTRSSRRGSSAPTAAEPAGLGLSIDVVDGRVIGAGLATSDETVRLPWQPGRADYAPFEAWLASDAPKIMTDAKPQLKALARSGLAFDGLVLDTLVAGWLVRPGLAGEVARRPGLVLPRRDGAAARPRPARARGGPRAPARPSTPGTRCGSHR